MLRRPRADRGQASGERRQHRDSRATTPNSDTLYSQLGAGLRREPLVITVPEVDAGRYYSLQPGARVHIPKAHDDLAATGVAPNALIGKK